MKTGGEWELGAESEEPLSSSFRLPSIPLKIPRNQNRDRVMCHVSSIAQKSPKAVALHLLYLFGSLKLLEF